jgi:hypothetical protein
LLSAVSGLDPSDLRRNSNFSSPPKLSFPNSFVTRVSALRLIFALPKIYSNISMAQRVVSTNKPFSHPNSSSSSSSSHRTSFVSPKSSLSNSYASHHLSPAHSYSSPSNSFVHPSRDVTRMNKYDRMLRKELPMSMRDQRAAMDYDDLTSNYVSVRPKNYKPVTDPLF